MKETYTQLLDSLLGNLQTTCRQSGVVPSSQQVAYMYANLLELKHVSKLIHELRKRLYESMLDEVNFDYGDYARKLLEAKELWCKEIAGGAVFELTFQEEKYYLTHVEDIVKEENTRYDYIHLLDDTDEELTDEAKSMSDIRNKLLKRSTDISMQVEGLIEDVAHELDGIVEDATYKQNTPEVLRELYKKYEELFFDSEFWHNALQDANDELNEDTSKGNLRKQQRRLEHQLKLTDLGSYYLQYLKSNGSSMEQYIHQYRRKITMQEFAEFLRLSKLYELRQEQIDLYEWLQPAERKYKLLFKNKAAQRLLENLVPLLSKYVDFRSRYHYAALLMAIIDCDLCANAQSCVAQFVNFVNNTFLSKADEHSGEGGKIKDPTSISRYTGGLLGGSFKQLNTGNLSDTNLNESDFNALSPLYARCVAMIGAAMGRDLQTEGFHSYVLDVKLPDMDNFLNDVQNIQLKNALRGEMLNLQ